MKFRSLKNHIKESWKIIMENNEDIFVGPEESKKLAKLINKEVNSSLLSISQNLDTLVDQRQPFLVLDILSKLKTVCNLVNELNFDSQTYVHEVLIELETGSGESSNEVPLIFPDDEYNPFG